MNLAFLLTTIAGFSTLLGTIPIFIKIKDQSNLIAASCAFASGVMISISILDLIPSGINYLNSYFSNSLVLIFSFLFMIIGIIISLFFEKMVDKYSNGNGLFRVGILAMIVIILHNIPEGIVTYIVSNHNIFLGVSLCIAIAIHNIPEGISISIPIYFATGSKVKAIFYTFVSAISELLGAILTYLFLANFINNLILGFIFNFTAGVMIAISLEKLLPTSKSYNKNKANIFFIIGFIFMLFSLLLNSLIS